MRKKMSLRMRLVVFFLLVGVVPFALTAGLALHESSQALSEASYDQLTSMRDIKKSQVENYFAERKGDMGVLMETVATLRREAFAKLSAVQTIKKNQIQSYFNERLGDISVLSGNDTVLNAMTAFEAAYEADGDKVGGTQWLEAEGRHATWLEQYNREYGYYDLFLIHGDGDVVYTVAKEDDLGANVVTGPLKDSPLGRCFAKATGGIALQDFEPYTPSGNAPSAFVGAPIRQDGKTLGVVALQLSLDAINNIMQERTGLGETGECYLVGPDKRMRSDSFLDPMGHTVTASFAGTIAANGCDTEAARKALAGNAGADVITDYNGNPVLSAYAPLKVGDSTWAVLAEMDVAEAFCPKDASGEYFFAKYIEKYGYYEIAAK